VGHVPGRLIRHQQLHHHGAGVLGTRVVGGDFHPLARRADAARGENALALDLHHAGAAVTVGPVARLVGVAEMRDIRGMTLRGLPDGLARVGVDIHAVELEGDGLSRAAAHDCSSGKYSNTDFNGFAAA
jgi:hypothetical protein